MTVTARCARFCRPLGALLALCVAVHSGGGLVAGTSPELDEVVAVWRNRQAQVQTAEVIWEQNRDGMNGWSNYQSAWAARAGYERTQPGHVLKLSGGRARYETDRWYHRIDFEYSGYYTATSLEFAGGRSDPFYKLHIQEPVHVTYERARQGRFSDPDEQQRDPWRLTSLCDGKTWTDVFQQPPRDAAAHSEVVIRAIDADRPLPFSQIMEDLFFRPVLLLYRPLDPALGGCRPDRWELLPDDAQVDARTCRVIHEAGADGWETRYFVDPQRQFVVVRAVIRQNAITRAQLDVQYDDELFPVRWTTVLFSDQADFPGQSGLPCFAAADVTQCVINVPLDEADFQTPAFPRNSLVVDQTTRAVSIIRADGSERMVTREEMSLSDADFAQVAATATGDAPRRDQGSTATRWLLVVTGVAFGLAALMAVWKRLRKERPVEHVAAAADRADLSSSAPQ